MMFVVKNMSLLSGGNAARHQGASEGLETPACLVEFAGNKEGSVESLSGLAWTSMKLRPDDSKWSLTFQKSM